jgi:uncharacterized protein (DUF2141 family)
MIKHKLPFILLLFSSLTSAEPQSGTLILTVSGGQANHGQAIVSLFNSEETFLKKPLRSQTKEFVEVSYLSFVFAALPYGSYAISVIFDEDKDNELDTGWFGIPTEMVGMSNNAKGKFGPPKFADAQFDFNGNMSMQITLDSAN